MHGVPVPAKHVHVECTRAKAYRNKQETQLARQVPDVNPERPTIRRCNNDRELNSICDWVTSLEAVLWLSTEVVYLWRNKVYPNVLESLSKRVCEVCSHNHRMHRIAVVSGVRGLAGHI